MHFTHNRLSACYAAWYKKCTLSYDPLYLCTYIQYGPLQAVYFSEDMSGKKKTHGHANKSISENKLC